MIIQRKPSMYKREIFVSIPQQGGKYTHIYVGLNVMFNNNKNYNNNNNNKNYKQQVLLYSTEIHT